MLISVDPEGGNCLEGRQQILQQISLAITQQYIHYIPFSGSAAAVLASFTKINQSEYTWETYNNMKG